MSEYRIHRLNINVQGHMVKTLRKWRDINRNDKYKDHNIRVLNNIGSVYNRNDNGNLE